jgi:hypothetical protein
MLHSRAAWRVFATQAGFRAALADPDSTLPRMLLTDHGARHASPVHPPYPLDGPPGNQPPRARAALTSPNQSRRADPTQDWEAQDQHCIILTGPPGDLLPRARAAWASPNQSRRADRTRTGRPGFDSQASPQPAAPGVLGPWYGRLG